MDAYFVFGPYHLFNAVNLRLATFPTSKAILYIFNTFRDCEYYYEALTTLQSPIFESVYLVTLPFETNRYCFETMPAKTKLTKAIRLLKRKWFSKHFPEKYYQFLPNQKQYYQNIFVAGLNIPILESYFFQQIHHGAQIHIIDDGLHRRNICEYRPYTFAQKINSFLHLWMPVYITDYYFYSPDQILASFNCPVIEQTKPTVLTIEQKKQLNHIFRYDKSHETIQQFKGIYFSLGGSPDQRMAMEEQFIHLANNVFSKKQFAVKWHPSVIDTPLNIETYQTKCPWEMIGLHYDLSNTVLISMLSAAMFNPKFIYDQEPYLIFTYRIAPINIATISSMNCAEFDYAIQHTLISHYRNPEKIMIPNSIEEYIFMLKQVQQMQLHAGQS